MEVTKSAAALLAKADADGSVMISSGVWLNSRENIQSDQRGWSEADECKETDFSAYPYWISTDSGDDPIPISGADDSDLHKLID